tara:strand:- start:23 stop:205 length:183 start_codon:yes stop_codon:yes gene_type:complete
MKRLEINYSLNGIDALISFEELFEVYSRFFSKVLTFGQIDQNISTFYKENIYHNLFICVK